MKNWFNLTIVVLVLTVLAGCASAPSGAQTDAGGDIPAWVTTPPADTADAMFFVGAGSDSGGDEAAARKQASGDLVSSITRFLGVKVSSNTTVEAKDSLDQFTSSLSQTIEEESEARLGNFRIKDTYTERRGTLVNVYLLGEYDKQSLLQEKARLKALFEEQQEAVSGPELEGDKLAAQGRYYDAAVQYLTAAAAAATSQIDNAMIKYERNMTKARDAVAKIELIKLNDNLTANINEAFPEAFRLRVTAQGASGRQGLAGVPIKVVFKEMRQNGRTAISSETVMSDANGEVQYKRPAPQFVGRDELSMEVDLSASLEPLEDVPDSMYPQLEAVENMIGDKEVSFVYTVVSRAREIPTAIMIADVDNGGTYLNKSETASGVLETLTQEGFSVGTLPVDMGLLRGPDAVLIDQVRNRFGGRYRRVIFGTVGISDFREDENRYMVKVSGDVKVADLETGDILYSSGNLFKSAIGQNIQSAMSAAFKQFGKMLGDSLARSLP
jgi:hypothetical protein